MKRNESKILRMSTVLTSYRELLSKNRLFNNLDLEVHAKINDDFMRSRYIIACCFEVDKDLFLPCVFLDSVLLLLCYMKSRNDNAFY